MIERDLLKEPFWEGKHLGQAIPQSPHAVSVALPRWKDVLAYEEKDPDCINSLQSVYPRFGLNPLIRELAEKALAIHGKPADSAWPYPNIKTASKARDFCKTINANANGTIYEVAGLQCLIVNKETTKAAKAFWQHTGLGASSRQAAIALAKEISPSINAGKNAKRCIRNRLSKIYGCEESLVQLHPSGMAALTTALESLKRFRPNSSAMQLGFPYVDVLKLPQIIFGGSELLLNPDPIELAKQLDKKNPLALIVELPSNPMLKCVDLPLVAKIAHDRGIPVIADDTIGSAINIDPLPYADIVFSSLTKSFAGRGDILAGSLVISPESPWKQTLKELIKISCTSELSDADAIALEQASHDVRSRIYQLNKACFTLKTHLESHPDIARVLHPAECPNFQSLMKANAGFGCLLSIQLKGELSKTKRFYDSLKVCKGPSLGTNFTLACPYVLLAHYNELDWARQCGVPTELIRISVGLEQPQELWERFERALKD
ncbi:MULTISPECIES: PLP-dependent transferase [unclassified Prochlorococcus]|uniref:PLP-dependent transferase n=1 Tax=unclassified Prochlorococcus TaxID=2627481 RepID=UPI0005337843|nr:MULTISPECIES: PLP-dependent transferase [unclassified Prochlorococcus]KGG16557.1 Cystathionine gamma-synthase [Prochlorococcus sp. MIT 0602]KGG16968.1 Cystathionine gamma-synthase [Prochlorococcus sp. MIT 0603]